MKRLAPAVVTALLALPLHATTGAQAAGQVDAVQILPVKGNIWMLSAGGSNVMASVGKDGILLVDTGSAGASDRLLTAVHTLGRLVTSTAMPQTSCIGVVHGCAWWNSSTFLPTTAAPAPPKPIVGIVNTSFDADHAGGNERLAAAGRRIMRFDPEPAWIIAHENAPKGSDLSEASQPTETYNDTSHKLNFFNGEAVVLWHLPAAHTDGDTLVQFRGSEVLAAGDIFNMTSYPVIELAKGGSIQGTIDALNWILDIAVVEHMMEGGTMVIPGHGRMGDSADVAYYRDMVTIVRDRVRAAMTKGLTLEQIKAARITRDYDGRFGRNPTNTPDMFVEAVYRSLASKS